jgi:hypothetical protein
MRESSVVTRILNVVQSTSSTQRIEAGDGPLPMAAFSTEPCSRCGIYGVRPSLCRLYPFIVDDDGERLAIGGQEICPEQWLQTEATVAGVADAVDQLRIDREHDRQIVLAWNKGRRARNFDGLLTFLENEAATALGYEPQRLASFGG